MSLINVVQQRTKSRINRTPSFPMAGQMAPYGLYPLMAHPVLPGETLQSVTSKIRIVSQPLKHPLAGSWAEFWFVYVKMTDLGEDFTEMFISDSVSSSPYQAGADRPRYFTESGQIDWVKLCVEKVHGSYFRDEAEPMRTIDSVPMVKLNNVSWYQNLMFEPADATVPTTDASDLYQHLQGWAMLQQMQLTELSYEQYLETYGVRPQSASDNDPEILRFFRSWTQPTNTVEPTTGKPSSALIWSEEIKADKPKMFKEPGFLLLLGTVRPKMFNRRLGNMVGGLWGFADWFPSYTLEDPTAGVKNIAKNDPVFAAAMTDAGGEAMIYDHRDLLYHGETFVNVEASEDIYPLPSTTGHDVRTGTDKWDQSGQYPTEADILALYAADPEPTDPARFVYEGITMPRISGHIGDTTR